MNLITFAAGCGFCLVIEHHDLKIIRKIVRLVTRYVLVFSWQKETKLNSNYNRIKTKVQHQN